MYDAGAVSVDESTCAMFFVVPDDLKPVIMAWRRVVRVPAASPAMLPGLDLLSKWALKTKEWQLTHRGL
jgi:hypothetical protein